MVRITTAHAAFAYAGIVNYVTKKARKNTAAVLRFIHSSTTDVYEEHQILYL